MTVLEKLMGEILNIFYLQNNAKNHHVAEGRDIEEQSKKGRH